MSMPSSTAAGIRSLIYSYCPPLAGGGGELKPRLAIYGRGGGCLVWRAGCVGSQLVEVVQLAQDRNAVVRAQFLELAEVVREWELHLRDASTALSTSSTAC